MSGKEMVYLLLLLLGSHWVDVWCYNSKRDEGVKEYCMQDSFNATCKSTEIILMKSAMYGRMRAGKCIDRRDKLNCSKDILPQMDTLCSGKQTCVFTFPGTDKTIYETFPCGKDYTSYMEASYKCMKVETTTKDHCLTRKQIRVTSRHGFISSQTTQRDNIGSYHCPWLIETNPGQHINLTIYNFIWNHSKTPHSPYTFNGEYYETKTFERNGGVVDGVYPCNKVDIGVIYEAGKQKTVTVCTHSNTRVVESYMSLTNTVSFKFVDKKMLTSLGRFLVEYRVTGCADIGVPGDTWAERDGSTLKVKCNKSRNAWYLTCSGDTWVGKVGNCSFGSGVEILNLDYSVNVENTEPFPYGILFVVAIGVAIGIVLGGGMLVALVMYNKTREKDRGPFIEGPQRNSGMYVNPQTRAWVQAHQHPKEAEHEQQYIDEGIVRDIQSFNSKDPTVYADAMANEIRGHNNAPIQQVNAGQFHHVHYSPSVEGGRVVRGDIGQVHRAPAEHIGVLPSHMYERPQSQ